jgi:hypothetical protein
LSAAKKVLSAWIQGREHEILSNESRGLRTILAAMILVLGTPGVLAGRTIWWRHGWVATFALADVPVLFWWADAVIVGAVVDLTAWAAGWLLVSDFKSWVRGNAKSQEGESEDECELHVEAIWLIVLFSERWLRL